MKKSILLACALMLAGHALKAQQSDAVTATLQDGAKTTVFSGFNSFKQALDSASQEGAVIILSSGSFANPGNIQKSIKLYGAGFQPDTLTGVAETRVMGDLRIQSTDEFAPKDVYIEGINGTGYFYLSGTQAITGTTIAKCKFDNQLRFQVNTDQTLIRQCYLPKDISGESKVATNFVISNCHLQNIGNNFDANSSLIVANCILTHTDCVHNPALYKNNLVANNYYGGGYRSGSLGGGSTCYNNIGWQGCIECNNNNVCSNNYYQTLFDSNWSNIFADGQNNLNYLNDAGQPRDWTLAEPEKYVGTDGTPCGLTGGDYPWNPIPSTPRIISSSVDNKTVDGKLKVTIKAEARAD